MGNLQNTTIYLSGAIEAKDDPTSWRNAITPRLAKLGIKVWNPLVKPSWIPDISPDEQREWKQGLNNTDYISRTKSEQIKSGNNLTRRFCLALAAQCNIFLVKIDKNFTVGTFEELNLAVQCHKPILVISKERIPSMWLLDQLLEDYIGNNDVFFKDEDQLMWYLSALDKDISLIRDKMKWMFLTYDVPKQ